MKLRAAILGAVLAACSAPAFGQCAMCYMAAKGAPLKSQKALNNAVVFLLVPPVGMMSILIGGGFLYARRRDQEVAEQKIQTV